MIGSRFCSSTISLVVSGMSSSSIIGAGSSGISSFFCSTTIFGFVSLTGSGAGAGSSFGSGTGSGRGSGAGAGSGSGSGSGVASASTVFFCSSISSLVSFDPSS